MTRSSETGKIDDLLDKAIRKRNPVSRPHRMANSLLLGAGSDGGKSVKHNHTVTSTYASAASVMDAN